jgi:SAM-dependent methyltransferase
MTEAPALAFLREGVRGKSFADIGGLLGGVYERVTDALAHGAASAAMIDICPADQPGWDEFRARCRARGAGPVHCLVADAVELGERPDAPRFDVVHCSGVIYHAPDPARLLRALRRLTAERLFLRSVVVPSVLRNEAGTLALPPCGALSVPALSEPDLAVLAAHALKAWGPHAWGLTCPGEPWERDLHRKNWWWLWTPEGLAALCSAEGWRVAGQWAEHGGNTSALLLDAA